LGGAVAPATLLFFYNIVGWRGAFIASGALGLIIAALVALQPAEPSDAPIRSGAKPAQESNAANSGWVLLAPVILLNFAFFTLLAFQNGGLQNYSVVAFAALYDTPLALGNAALSGYLLLAAAGVLLGGILVSRTSHHGAVVTICICVTATTAVLLGLFDLGSFGITLVMSIAGLAYGATMPSRDMIVRQVTPPGSFGKVFGFVTSGFNFAGVIAPMIYGPLMDHGYPGAVFLVVAAGSLVSIATVATVRTRKRRS
jgi:MFS family permease